MKGRPPKPTKLKIIEGNRGKRPLNENEPKPQPIAPECPDWLCEDAKIEWARVAPELENLGLLTRIDMAALVGYCESWAEYKKAKQFIHKKGESYIIRNDDEDKTIKYIQQFPQVAIANKALQQIRAFCTLFGLSPSDRGRLQLLGQADTEDEMEQLLKGGR